MMQQMPAIRVFRKSDEVDIYYCPHPKDGEGNIFSLCVSSHLDGGGGGGGGNPIHWQGGTPFPGLPRSRGVPPSQVQMGGGGAPS